MDIGTTGHGGEHNGGYALDLPAVGTGATDLSTSGVFADHEEAFKPGMSEETFERIESLLAELELYEQRFRFLSSTNTLKPN